MSLGQDTILAAERLPPRLLQDGAKGGKTRETTACLEHIFCLRGRMMSHAAWRRLGVLTALCLAAGLAAAEEKPAQAPISGKAAIRERLKAKITVDVEGTPLAKTLALIGQQLGVRIEVDEKALDDIGANLEELRVTVQHRQVEARAVLGAICRRHDLDWVVEDEWLCITTSDRADARLATIVYDVSDLVLFQDKKGEWQDDGEPLIATINAAVAPMWWDRVGGPGRVECLRLPTSTVLVVAQTEQRHDEVADFLAQLRAVAAASKKAQPRPTLEQLLRRTVKENPDLAAAAHAAEANRLPVNPERDALAHSVNALGCDLYRKLAQSAPGNLLCSPPSVAVALGMLRDGARGATAAELTQALRLQMNTGGQMAWAIPEAQVPATFTALRSTWSAESAKHGCDLWMANRLWSQSGWGPIEARYRELLGAQYQADWQEVNFRAADDAVRQINAWVGQQSRGLMSGRCTPAQLNAQTAFVLTSVVYFRGQWAGQFSKVATRSELFDTGAAQIPTPMMSQQARLRYAEADGLQILEKPYLGDALSMVLLLPARTRNGLRDLEQRLTPKLLEGWLHSLDVEDVDVRLPRFAFDVEYDLRATLDSLGVKLAFDPEKADLSGIGAAQQLFLQWIRHAGRIEVDEEGTRGTLVAIGGGTFGGPGKVARFRADHPFLFLIRDVRTGAILFLGRVVTPTRADPREFPGG